MVKILITGGSGLVGRALTERLLEKGYEVCWLTHSNKKNTNIATYKWDLKKSFVDENAFKGISHIIHLAGAGIAEKNWTKKYKKHIADSRIQTSQLLFEYVKKLEVPLKAFISASAIGYYGTFTSEKTLTEDSPSGNDFLAKVCLKWEANAQQFQEQLNIRTVCLRTGVVLSNKGGALPKIKRPISLGVGASLGSGKQYMPWIHIDDLIGIYIKAIEDNTWQGTYNATAPDQVTNEQVTRQIALLLKKHILLPNIPAFVLRMALGKKSILLLKGAPVAPKRIEKENFSFLFSSFGSAIRDILCK